MPESETVVEVYALLMTHLAKDGLSGVVTSWTPPIVHVKANGNLVIQGKQVTDPQTLASMNILVMNATMTSAKGDTGP
jgi:hypothetical protein